MVAVRIGIVAMAVCIVAGGARADMYSMCATQPGVTERVTECYSLNCADIGATCACNDYALLAHGAAWCDGLDVNDFSRTLLTAEDSTRNNTEPHFVLGGRSNSDSNGNAGLFLSAALSIGGWHLVRSAKHLRFSLVPEWFHAGAPYQIGHSIVVELDSNNLPIPSFLPLLVEQIVPVISWRTFDCSPSRYGQSSCLSVESPRGPPLLI